MDSIVIESMETAASVDAQVWVFDDTVVVWLVEDVTEADPEGFDADSRAPGRRAATGAGAGLGSRGVAVDVRRAGVPMELMTVMGGTSHGARMHDACRFGPRECVVWTVE